MNMLYFLFELFRDWTAFAFWQSFLILGLAVTLERFLRRSPWQAHLLLTLAVLASILTPTVSLFIFRSGGGVMSPGSIFALEKQAEGVVSLFGLAIMIGCPLFLASLMYGIVAARRLMFHAKPFPDRVSQDALLEGARLMQNSSLPVLFTSPLVNSPTVWSWGLHPAVLLPESLSEALSPEERDGIFLHELAHITRRDHWTALLIRLCGIALFWQPLYWLALKLSDLAADRACDLLVLSQEKISPEVYGETLLRLAAGEKNRPVFQHLSRKEQFMNRIDTILDYGDQRDRYSVARTPLKMVPLVLGFLMLATVLAFCQEKTDRFPFTAPENRLTHLVTFEPTKGFEANAFADLHAVYNSVREKSSVKWMFTKMERDKDGKQIFLCLTDDPEKMEAVIESLPQLKFVKAERLTKESYEKHTASWKNRDKQPEDGGYATPDGGFTHLVVFEANEGFDPRGPMAFLNLVNPKLNEFGVHCGYFRTKAVDEKLIAYNATSTPDEYIQLLESIPQMKYLETRRLTKEMFEAYEKTAQESLSSPPSKRLPEIEKADWFQKLNDSQKHYTRWDENQFVADYALTLPESESERKALEKQWIELLEGKEPVRRRYGGQTDEFTRAIIGLTMLKSTRARELLTKIACERVFKDNAYRHASTKALGMLGDSAATPDLIPLIYHFNFNTRIDAQITLVRLTGQNFGYDAEAWGNWYNAHRNELGKDLPEFDLTPVDWTCGQNDPQIRMYSNPEFQKTMDAAWLMGQGGTAQKESKPEKSANSESRSPIWFLDQEAQDRPPHIEVWNGNANMMTMVFALRFGEGKRLELTEDQQKRLSYLAKPQELGVEWFQKMYAERNVELLEAEKATAALIPADDPLFEKASPEQKKAYVEACSKKYLLFYRHVQREVSETLTAEQLNRLRSLEFIVLPTLGLATPHMFDSLGLSAEQRKQVEAIKKECEPEFLKLLDEQMELRKEHLVLYTQGKNSGKDRAEYNSRYKEQEKRRIEFANRLKERLAKDVLTNEQRAQAQKLADQSPDSMKGAMLDPKMVGPEEKISSNTSAKLPVFPPMKDIEKDAVPLPEGLLQTLKAKRAAIKSAAYTVRCFSEQEKSPKAKLEGKLAYFRFDGPKRWFADISEIMQSDLFQTGCDGIAEWSLNISNFGTFYLMRPIESVRDIELSFLDALRLLDTDDDKLVSVMEGNKLRYFGTDRLDGREYHLFGSVTMREDWSGKTLTRTEMALDVATGLPGLTRTYIKVNGRNYNAEITSTYLFEIEKTNVEFSGADFLPEKGRGIQAVIKENLDEGYDRFYVQIDDGADGRMTVRSNGQKGPKGIASSGLN